MHTPDSDPAMVEPCRTNGGYRLVALTGWGQESDRRQSADAGFDRHVVKPIDRDLLQELLAGQ